MLVFKHHKEMETSVVKTVYSRLQRNLSMKDFRLNHHDNSSSNNGAANGESKFDFEITADLPWIIKDIVSDPVTFVLEIDPGPEENNNSVCLESLSVGTRERLFTEQDLYSVDGQPGNFSVDENGSSEDGEDLFGSSDDILEELENARSVGKPMRIYFRCNSDTNEKGLWLKAFASFGRLSRDLRSKKSLLSSLTAGMNLGTSRIRNKANEMLARDARHLDMSIRSEQRDATNAGDETNDIEYLVRGGKKTCDEKEFRVLPSYAYPHRWMTKAEMIEEMILPSDWFHDLRVPGCTDKEIGSLRVEVLQCVGLPRLDRGSDSDAVVYLVCGSYAFSTDIIYNRTNPMWLRKSRRACEFPVFHGYSRLFVGVFDDEPRRTKDDFAGRIVLDLARLRPNCEYDCTFPLRLSSHVYSRRRRGAVRLRFTLNWNSERDALLSYVPKTLRIPLPQFSKPNYDTTVMCSDQKAFRNIAITVHGAHLPGRFTFHQLRAVIREINFTRKYVFSTLLRNIKEIRQWQNPAMSAFVFFSWMHCIYANAFSLVPAYVVLFLFLNLMQNYARYGLDGPSQRGFVPPSWEEMFMALLRGGDRSYRAIAPAELKTNRKLLDSTVSYQMRTHEPKGKKLLRALGFMTTNGDPDADHIEFPFADGKLYPKLTVRQCLASKGALPDEETAVPSSQKESTANEQSTTVGQTPSQSSAMSRFNLDVDFLRKDSSGTKDYDAEEIKFGPGRAVMTQGEFLELFRRTCLT
jgi:C2 domain